MSQAGVVTAFPTMLEYTKTKGNCDEEIAQGGVRLFLKKNAHLALLETETDDAEDALFMFNNPNIKGRCGCRESLIFDSSGLCSLWAPGELQKLQGLLKKPRDCHMLKVCSIWPPYKENKVMHLKIIIISKWISCLQFGHPFISPTHGSQVTHPTPQLL